jgi:hypothetical protein
MWRRRWSQAKGLLEKKGVVLRAWRVGDDVSEECLKLVREELQRQQKEVQDLQGK